MGVCKDDKTCAGETFEEVAKFLSIFCPENLKAVGVNCCKPADVTNFGRAMKKYFPDMPLVAYPNTGEKWQRSNKPINTDKIVQNSKSEKAASEVTSENWVGNFGSWSGNPENIITHVESWLELGYSWIGGCCRVTPDDISEIRNIFDRKLLKKPEKKKDTSRSHEKGLVDLAKQSLEIF